MAGKRRDTERPMKRHARPARRRAAVNNRLAQTHDPLQRLSYALDYLRGALTLNPDPAVAEEVVTRLIQSADDLYTRKETSR
jgi:hypothetical protein